MQNTASETRLPVVALSVACVAGGLGCVALLVAALLRTAFGVSFPVSSATALLLLAGSPIVLRAGRWRGGARGALVAVASMLPMVVFLGMGAAYAMSDPLVSMHWRCGTADVGLVMITPPAIGILSLVGAAAGLFLMRERPGFDGALRYLAWGMVALGIVLAGRATQRAVQHPSVDNDLAAFPVVGTIGPQPSRDTGVIPVYEDGQPLTIDETVVDHVRIRRECRPQGYNLSACRWRLGADHGVPLVEPPDMTFPTAMAVNAHVTVRRGPNHVLLLTSADTLPGRQRAWAFFGPSYEPHNLYVKDVASMLAPPSGWILGAWAGVLIALVLLLRSDKVLADPTGRWHQGHHEGNGIVRMNDGSLTNVPVGEKLAVGPVVVLPTMDARIAGYRDQRLREPLQVLPGTVEELAMAARVRPVVRAVMAMVAVLLTAAPLVAAVGAGLLG